ncbi:MAG TPA: SDR family oxidoreductase [Chthoniobacterales bacterium]|nr:SDR family oxidoreductase [Chthoniobacterales bacterium]
MKEFEGKVALVTGGGSGIGRATALAFARDGAQVVIGNRNVQRGEETVAMIRKTGGTASFKRTDVLVTKDIEALVNHAVKEYGGLDLAFNNAGVEGDVAPIDEQTEANYNAVMDVNVKGVWLSMKYEIPRMLERGGGAIVNCSSVAGLIGFPNMSIYMASKHAVIGLTKVAALEYSAKGIRINAVNPAVIDTEMVDRLAAGFGMSKEADLVPLHPIGRIGRVEEIAAAVLWLCSTKSSFVTGHSLVVDGGFTAR